MRNPPVILAVLLVLAVSLSGCNAKDWYNQQGTVRLELAVYGDVPAELNTESRIEDFERLRVTLRGGQLRQDAVAGSINSPTMSDILDLVELAKSGDRVVLLEEKVNLRGFSQAVLRLEVLDGITAAGEAIPGCERGATVEEPPCIRYDRAGTYARALDPSEFHVPRGGTMTIVVPVGIGYTASVNEFFLFSGVPYHIK